MGNSEGLNTRTGEIALITGAAPLTSCGSWASAFAIAINSFEHTSSHQATRSDL